MARSGAGVDRRASLRDPDARCARARERNRRAAAVVDHSWCPKAERNGLIATLPRFFSRASDRKLAPGVLEQVLQKHVERARNAR